MSLDSNTVDSLSAAASITGLPLDARQRAMLAAMGIHVWQPVLEEKQAANQTNQAQAATHNIAKNNLTKPVVNVPAPSAAPASRAPAATPSHSVPAAVAATSAAANPFALQPQHNGIAQMDWLPLQSAIASCQACGLCNSRKTTVFGIGQPSSAPALAPRADWLIVGEAPSEDEDALGEPFAGAAGKLLDNMLHAMRVEGEPLARQRHVFITNVLKCRPPADRNPSLAELAMCQPYLLRQIALLQPRIILAMGRFAVQALTGSAEPLGKLRGRVHALQGDGWQAPVIVTYHPAYLLRNPSDKAKAWDDLLLAMDSLHGTGPNAQ